MNALTKGAQLSRRISQVISESTIDVVQRIDDDVAQVIAKAGKSLDTADAVPLEKLEKVAPSKFPDSGFDIDVLDSGQDLIGHNVEFRGAANRGHMQTTYTRSLDDLYIDTTRSQVNGEGLGEEMLRQAVRSAEQGEATVRTVSGNLRDVNRMILLSNGLEATPAYKIRVRNGFTKVLVAPTKENDYLLIMGK